MTTTLQRSQLEFRDEVRTWLAEHLVGEYRQLVGAGGPGDEEHWDLSLAWERELSRGHWTGIGWPVPYGGRGASIFEQVIFQEEYARARAPARVTHLGESMLGPTLIAYGTDEQRIRFLPGILAATEIWCQGYSEPDAGSDLASVRTVAELIDEEWHITGEKVWTSLAQHADYCFVICKTRDAPRHRNLSYLLVPMKQRGVHVKPIRQMTGTSEFNSVFFDNARASADLIVGAVHDGWRIAMATLGFERSRRLAGFPVMAEEFGRVRAAIQRAGKADDPVVRQRLAQLFIELEVMRMLNLRTLLMLRHTNAVGPEASFGKLFWSLWHQSLLELAVDVRGAEGLLVGDNYQLDALQQAFLYSRAETIFAGSTEIQRNIIGERVLQLPREPDILNDRSEED